MIQIVAIVLVVLAVVTVFKGAVIVPQQMRFVVERLGQYNKTLDAGFHVLIPYFDSSSISPLSQRAGNRYPRAGLHYER